MPKIHFLGSCREVGRSAILIESKNGTKCMFDYGVRFRSDERLPHEINLDDLSAVALTHCHIDHSGAIPYLYRDKDIPLFTNPVTLKVIETLIKDMIIISKYPYPFGYRELKRMMGNAKFLQNNIRQKIADDFYITFLHAGHVPGSVSILIEVDNKKILYTGDINTTDTNLVKPAKLNANIKLDALITESTYALREHPSRELLEEAFVENVIKITDDGGKVLIPAFGVARSQEVLLILKKLNYNGKIYMDGLAKQISMDYLNYPEALRDVKALNKAIKTTQFISKRERSFIKKSNGVLIAPSGMLKGGAAIKFMRSFLDDPRSAVYLVGYQVEGSPGRELLENGIFKYKEGGRRKRRSYNMRIKAKCDVNYFDFSSHADNVHLHQYVENLAFNKDSRDIFCVHGDPKATTTFASELVEKKYNSVAPETGEIYKI